MMVEIKEHERVAMLSCIQVLRSIAQTLDAKDRLYAQKLMVWTQAIEDTVERMEDNMLGTGCQKGRLTNDGA